MMGKKLDAVKGSCLCGAIEFQVEGETGGFHLCHCSRCRHSTGSAHCSNIFTAPEVITWLKGTEHIQRFELQEAERFAKQFCRLCGSPVPLLNRLGTMLVIPAGSLNGDIGIEPDDSIFWESRASWYECSADKPKFEKYPEST